MPKRKTTDEFIADAVKIHGNKYGYENVVYKNNKTKVKIYCNTCKKYFMQTPNDHLDGCGCPTCGTKMVKAKLYGVGINDLDEPISYKGKPFKFYKVWSAMLYRCYYKKFHEKEHTYSDCSVCNGWIYLSNFKRWFDENYIEGYELDKDLLSKGSKIYSPETCCFLPKEINTIFTNSKKNKSVYGIGVYKKGNIFYAAINKNTYNNYIGSFDNADDAREAYNKERRKYIIEIANKYHNNGAINEKIYDALIRYSDKEID